MGVTKWDARMSDRKVFELFDFSADIQVQELVNFRGNLIHDQDQDRIDEKWAGSRKSKQHIKKSSIYPSPYSSPS